jgi:peptide/nickel transport system substrate-binding protein
VIGRTGAWVDEVVFTAEVDEAAAVEKIQSGNLDIYAGGLQDSTLVAEIMADSDLDYVRYFVSSSSLLFNPSGPEFNDGRLNPFHNPKIRAVMNRLVDREYIVDQLGSDLYNPRLIPVFNGFPDYNRFLTRIQELENEYSYNVDVVKQTLAEEMQGMGASLVDDKWTYYDQPVTLIFLIRTEDQRRQIGDYIADQLESVGFTVDRRYLIFSESMSFFAQSEPSNGEWHLYTGSWSSLCSRFRDSGGDFELYYTPTSWLVFFPTYLEPADDFLDVARRLVEKDFTSLVERDQLFEKALSGALEDSSEVWLFESMAFTPWSSDIQVVKDLYFGVAASPAWPYTLRFAGTESGTVRWGQPDVIVGPWNPISGSGDPNDRSAILATQDYGIMPDPHTGLAWPQRIESAEVVVTSGLPVTATLDWVTVSYLDRIDVPEDAWVDWDAESQLFITAAEKFPAGITANIKSIVTYPADLFSKVAWDDGSPLSVGDFVMKMILTFDLGKPESPVYNLDYLANMDGTDSLDMFLSHFKGVRIISTDPLTIETYEDDFELDAELNVNTWWPNYPTGPGAWHTLGIGLRAEEDGQLSFSSQKAELGIDWMDYVTTGPHLAILNSYLEKHTNDNYIPYQSTLGQFVTSEEMSLRYANLSVWYAAHGHFWIGLGPFYLDSASSPLDTLTLKRNPSFPDPADKWAEFLAP